MTNWPISFFYLKIKFTLSEELFVKLFGHFMTVLLDTKHNYRLSLTMLSCNIVSDLPKYLYESYMNYKNNISKKKHVSETLTGFPVYF